MRSKPPDPWWVKLGDFGISKRAADDLAASSTVKGTLRYMAPELLGFVESSEGSGLRNAQAADMWALGEIAFQMLTKEPTFRNIGLLSTYVRSPDTFPSAVLRAHEVSEVGIIFISQVMQPKPEDRQTTTMALLHAWMEPYNPHTTEESLFVPTEYIMPNVTPLTAIDKRPRSVPWKAMPGSLEESVYAPSGRWSTVSMGAPQSRSSPNTSSSTTARELSTPRTTVSFPETNDSTLNSVTGGN